MNDLGWQVTDIELARGGSVHIARKDDELQDRNDIDEQVVVVSIIDKDGNKVIVQMSWDETNEFLHGMCGMKELDRFALDWVAQNYSPRDVWGTP